MSKYIPFQETSKRPTQQHFYDVNIEEIQYEENIWSSMKLDAYIIDSNKINDGISGIG